MAKIKKYQLSLVYLVFVFVILAFSGYFLFFLYNNFYLAISWTDNSGLYTGTQIKRIETEKLDSLVSLINKDRRMCKGTECNGVGEKSITPELECVESMGEGFGADCVWTKSEIHADPEGDPNKNFMVYRAKEAILPDTLTMRWPSIINCDAYRVYVSGDGKEWTDLGKVPEEACPFPVKTKKGNYNVSGIDFKVKYIKIAKLYDNEGDDSLDTPADVKLTGTKKVDKYDINFCRDE